MEALRALEIPNLRWPGGCFADDYHWRDGIGPPGQRPLVVNSHWGDVVEDNAFGSHEFLALCELLGAEPYVNGNVGSGTVREMGLGRVPDSGRRRADGAEEKVPTVSISASSKDGAVLVSASTSSSPSPWS